MTFVFVWTYNVSVQDRLMISIIHLCMLPVFVSVFIIHKLTFLNISKDGFSIFTFYGYHNWLLQTGWLNTIEIVSSHNFGGQQVEMKMLTRLIPSGEPEGKSTPWLSLGSWLLLTAVGFCTCGIPLCWHPYMTFPSCVLPFLSLIRPLTVGFRAHPDRGWSHREILTLIIPAKALTLNK